MHASKRENERERGEKRRGKQKGYCEFKKGDS
jgi:hypothetical protein